MGETRFEMLWNESKRQFLTNAVRFIDFDFGEARNNRQGLSRRSERAQCCGSECRYGAGLIGRQSKTLMQFRAAQWHRSGFMSQKWFPRGRRYIAMEWKEEYSVGIYEMDVQHQALARCMALVEKAVTSKQQVSSVQSALAQLADVVRIHFSVEESLMRIHGFSELDRHADEHLEFTDQLRILQEKSLRGEASEEMVANLANWFQLHITVSDRHYAAHFPAAKIATEARIRRNVTWL